MSKRHYQSRNTKVKPVEPLKPMEKFYKIGLVPVSSVHMNDLELQKIRVENWHDREDVMHLATSMQIHGIREPITVSLNPTNNKEPQYTLQVGLRRLLAARQLGWKEIPALILPEVPPVLDRYWDHVVSNSPRYRVSTYEIAHSAKTMRDRFQVSPREFAARTGYAENYVCNLLRCIDNLPTEVIQEWMSRSPIPMEQFLSWSHLTKEKAVKAMLKYIGKPSSVSSKQNTELFPSPLEPATDKGLIAQSMRHVESVMKTGSDTVSYLVQSQQREMFRIVEQNEKLAQQNIDLARQNENAKTAASYVQSLTDQLQRISEQNDKFAKQHGEFMILYQHLENNSEQTVARMKRIRFAVEVTRDLDEKTRAICLKIVDYCSGVRKGVPEI